MNILCINEVKYIAQIVDRHGTIKLYKYKNRKNRVLVNIRTRKVDILEKVKEISGVGIIYGNYIFYVQRNDIKPFLEEIISYLKKRKKNAQVVLEYINRKELK
jgi:hypothetical protein